tara:strand:+ start:630 stop:1388 length:759 start_codon:yes stop_codon:yes gene_type:complete
MNNELVSIITPLYNSEQFIKDTIESVINQTYKNWEMIIVDDASSDKSVTIVEKINNNKIILIKNEINIGPALTRNKAIERSSGRYIAFLDSDDLWHPDKLAKQLKFMNDNNYSFSFSAYEKIDDLGYKMGSYYPDKIKINYQDLLKTNYIGCLTSIIDLKLLGKKYFMPNIEKRQDQALWLLILKDKVSAYCLNELLAKYRVRKGSISKNKLSNIKFQWQLYRKIERINIFWSIYYMIFYTYHGLKKNSTRK